MSADGNTGSKGKGGFYRMTKTEKGRVKEAIALQTGASRPSADPALGSTHERKPQALLKAEDRGGQYARRVLGLTLAYAAAAGPEIADETVAVDEAMRWGYTWKFGPFELIDQIGVDNVVALLKAGNIEVPPLLQKAAGKSFYRTTDGQLEYLATAGTSAPVERRPGVLLLADIKRRSKPLARNGSASLWDIGDGVVCLEFHSKMNAMDPDIMAMLSKGLDTVKKSNGAFKALVVYNEAENFSVGANVGLALFAAHVALWPFFEQRALAKVSRSAAEARDMLVLRPSDAITMNRARLLADAKAKALDLAENYQPAKPIVVNLPGPTGAAALKLGVIDLVHQGKATAYDAVVAEKLAEVLSGGDTDMTLETSEDQLLALDRRAFHALIREPKTLARIEHTLETGRPLRN